MASACTHARLRHCRDAGQQARASTTLDCHLNAEVHHSPPLRPHRRHVSAKHPARVQRNRDPRVRGHERVGAPDDTAAAVSLSPSAGGAGTPQGDQSPTRQAP
jgi:hypothetical protein